MKKSTELLSEIRKKTDLSMTEFKEVEQVVKTAFLEGKKVNKKP